ncbi:MAG: triphosphoribosyl-dephospho-CoA synthase [Planctomycetota bacterium]
MTSPLQQLRWAWPDVSSAIRYACILEATAPKPGNVHPGAGFHDLSFRHFAIASEITSLHLSHWDTPLGERMLNATTAIREACQTNVNLGIILLLGPIIEAERHVQVDASNDVATVTAAWQRQCRTTVETLPATQGHLIGRAIAHAAPGGMNTNVEVDSSLDVSNEIAAEFDLLSAMRHASDRDEIARQYSNGFFTLFSKLVPLLDRSIDQQGDVLTGIAVAQVRWMQQHGDSLINRKVSPREAQEIQQQVMVTNPKDAASLAELDTYLRDANNRRNPGTTADLIAAALYICLRMYGRRFQSESPA